MCLGMHNPGFPVAASLLVAVDHSLCVHLDMCCAQIWPPWQMLPKCCTKEHFPLDCFHAPDLCLICLNSLSLSSGDFSTMFGGHSSGFASHERPSHHNKPPGTGPPWFPRSARLSTLGTCLHVRCFSLISFILFSTN